MKTICDEAGVNMGEDNIGVIHTWGSMRRIWIQDSTNSWIETGVKTIDWISRRFGRKISNTGWPNAGRCCHGRLRKKDVQKVLKNMDFRAIFAVQKSRRPAKTFHFTIHQKVTLRGQKQLHLWLKTWFGTWEKDCWYQKHFGRKNLGAAVLWRDAWIKSVTEKAGAQKQKSFNIEKHIVSVMR